MMDAWIDEELPQKERMLFESHLDDCRTCSKKAEQLRRLTDLLGAATSPRPSADLEKKTLSAVVAETDTKRQFRWRISMDWKMCAAMAASLLIGLGIGYQLGVWLDRHRISG